MTTNANKAERVRFLMSQCVALVASFALVSSCKIAMKDQSGPQSSIVSAMSPEPLPAMLQLEQRSSKALVLKTTFPVEGPHFFKWVSRPSHGSFFGEPPELLYTPDGDYFGADEASFQVSDGVTDSSPAKISIEVSFVNRAPTANTQSVVGAQRVAKAINLSGLDPDNQALTYTIVAPPGKGTLAGVAPNLTYTPIGDAVGADTFTFKVNDGTIDSVPASVALNIAFVNRPPAANAQSVSLNQRTARAIALTGQDPDPGQGIAFAIVTNPLKGSLSGTIPNLTYVPNGEAVGADSFTFRVSDGLLFSNTATVSLTIIPVSLIPPPGPAPAPAPAPRLTSTQSLIRSANADGGSGYGYAPSIIHEGNNIHLFYCSNGDAASWDVIRYSSSSDRGNTWTTPSVVLRAKGTRDRAACDPSVVNYNGTFYLFYTGNLRDAELGQPDYCNPATNPAILNFYRLDSDTNSAKTPISACGQSSIHVARSTSGQIAGPYQPILDSPTQAALVIARRQLNRPASIGIKLPNEMPYSYGSGQNALVVTPSNELWMWYYDDSDLPIHTGRTYLAKMNAGATGVASIHPTNVFGAGSADVKYDPSLQKYVMIHFQCRPGDDCDDPRAAIPSTQVNACLSAVHPAPFDTSYCSIRFTRHGHHTRQTSIVRRFSSDGVNWSEPQVVVRTHARMDWAHNIGMSSDVRGHLLPEWTLIAAGGLPENKANCAPGGFPCWANWNIIGTKVMNHLPYGYVDSLSNTGLITGWAFDPDDSSVSIALQVTKILGGSRVPVATLSANRLRTDVNNVFEISGSHGFAYQIPLEHRSAAAAYEVRAVDYSTRGMAPTGINPELQMSPKSNVNLH